LLALTLRDLRRLLTRPAAWTLENWQRRGYGRLASLPDGAARLRRFQFLAALLVGAEIIRLVRIARRLGLSAELDATIAPRSRGDVTAATAGFAALDDALAAREVAGVLRAQGRILAISQALTQHAAYFEMEA